MTSQQPAPPATSPSAVRTWHVAVAEPYGWLEGGNDDDWVKSLEALRDQLVRLGKSGCFFTRRYFKHFTLNAAILSGDKQSITNVLLGGAVEVPGDA